ncbi:NUDIX domain-containing protein [Kitasatospora aburaviensis]
MAIPAFLAELRSVVGTRKLWLSAAVTVVLDDRDRVLLLQRADDGRWALPGGSSNPGSSPPTARCASAWRRPAWRSSPSCWPPSASRPKSPTPTAT